MELKQIVDIELNPGLAEALTGDLDPAYVEWYTALAQGQSRREIEQRIAAIPEQKRYLTRVLDCLDAALADSDSETALLDLPHMRQRDPETIRRYLGIRLEQIRLLLAAVNRYIAEHPAPPAVLPEV